jgi:hypothetical protein
VHCSQCSPGGEGSGGGGWLAVSWQAGGGAAAVRRRASAVSALAARFVDRLSLASHRQTYVRPPCSGTRASASCRWPRPRHVTARPDGRQGFRLLATRLQCVLLCVRAGDGEEGKPGTVKSGRKPSHHEPPPVRTHHWGHIFHGEDGGRGQEPPPLGPGWNAGRERHALFWRSKTAGGERSTELSAVEAAECRAS